MIIKKTLLSLLFLVAATAAMAQLRINWGKDSPVRKLQIAEMAITNLYVDSVNEPYPLPKGWVKWAMWQYAEDGRTQGYLWNDLNVVSNWFKIYLDSKWGETITPTPKKFPYSITINDKTYKEAQ